MISAKDMKKKKQKQRFKEMDKRSPEKGNDLMDAYAEDKEELYGVADASQADGARLTYSRDFLLQLQTNPLCMLKPEGLPDLECVLRQARTPSRSSCHQTRTKKPDGGENMFLPAFMRQESRLRNSASSRSGFNRRGEPAEDSESISLRFGRRGGFAFGAWPSRSSTEKGVVDAGVGPSAAAGSATGGSLATTVTDNTPTNRKPFYLEEAMGMQDIGSWYEGPKRHTYDIGDPAEDSESISLRFGRRGGFAFGAWPSRSSTEKGVVDAGVGPSAAAGSATGGSLATTVTDNTPTNRYVALVAGRKLSAPARARSGDTRRQEPRSPVSGGGRRGPFSQAEREKALEALREVTQPKKIKFALGQNPSSQNTTGSTGQHSARIQEELRTVILKRKARNEEAFDWIDKNVSPADAKDSPFIRALVTAVCEGAMDREEGGVCKCNADKLKDRKILLQRYIDSNTSLEVQAVYAVQALFVGLDYPPGFIKSYFGSFYDEEIVTEESFFSWLHGDEEPGKGVTVVNAQEFFRWFKSAEEAEDYSWTERTHDTASEVAEASAHILTDRAVKKKTHSVIEEYLNNGDPKAEDAREFERVNSHEKDLWSSHASKDPADSLASVPTEILSRGRLAIEAYNKALREGTTSLKRLPVMLIGQDRSGKTSLKKSLRGENFNPNEKSTVGIEKDPSHFQVTTELWKAGVKDRVTDSTAATSYEHHAAKLIVNSLTEEQMPTEESLEPILHETPSLPSADGAVVEDVTTLSTEFLSCEKQDGTNLEQVQSRAFPTTGSQSSLPSHEDASEPLDAAISRDSNTTTEVQDVKTLVGPRVNSSSLSDEPEVPHDIASLVAKLLHKGTKVEDDGIYSVLWDFGGQSVYYVTHPLFLTPRAIYVLVYDLSRDPCERADPPVNQGMFKTFKDQFSLKTHLDYLYFWMTSVSSLACQAEDGEILLGPNCDVLPEKLPPVFLVCSHADKPYGGKDPHTLANDIFDSLQRNPYSNHLVESVFVVDNTLSGSELECSEVVRLRQHILAVAEELPQMKELIPIKWLKYEKALHLTKKEGHKWISLESAKQIAFEVCKIPDDQEFFTLLNFLHDQRIVIHFDDTPELGNFVVLDPQWLIDVFSKVITVKPYANEERKFKDLWRKLEGTGVLEEDLLKHVWGPLLSQKETYESLIAIMEKFSLLCPWPPSAVFSAKQYLVPSMLMSHPPQDIVNLVSSALLPSLFVKFKSGQVPPGLFPRLMLQFFQWGKEEFWSTANPHLFHKFARFYTSGDEDCSVVVLCHSSFIEVVVHRANRGIESAKCLQSKVNVSADAYHDAFEVACACTVQRQLSLMLESMRKEFCWLRNMRYEVGVICPVCCQGGVLNYCRDHHTQDCERGECLHFLSESELRSAKQSISCTRSAAATNNKVYVKQFAPWFESPKEQYSQQPVVRSGGRLLPSSIGNEHKSVVLPRKVVTELLSWKSKDPKEIVLQLEKSLQVDQSSLKQPGPETKKLVRYVASKAKHFDRLDVVEHLRTITPAGTTGPLLPGELDVRNIPVRQMRELTVDLSGGDEWKEVAERLGLTPKEIRYLDKRTMNPFDAVLAYISQQCYYINVDDLYDVLNECGLPVLADLL